MAISKLTVNARAGSLRQCLEGVRTYESFVPAPLPPQPPLVVDEDMLRVLVDAHRALAELEGVMSALAQRRTVLSHLMQLEALSSCRIEGSAVTQEDLWDPRLDSEKDDKIGEVLDLLQATVDAINVIKTPNRPLTLAMFCVAHAVLMRRHPDKSPGAFRQKQAWITSVKGAGQKPIFVPPAVDDMQKALADLERFWSEGTAMDPLIKAALIHYQFETIHPFIDGNGRVGRLLVCLYLMQTGVITLPLLPLTYALNLNRRDYYDALTAVREKGDFQDWVKFFLEMTTIAAQNALQTVRQLESLHRKNVARIEAQATRPEQRRKWLEFLAYLEKQPVVELKQAAHDLQVTFPTISKLAAEFVSLGLLKETTGKKRDRLFSYMEILTILRKDDRPL